MVYFLGILDPGLLDRRRAAEAPAKARFFGGRIRAHRLRWYRRLVGPFLIKPSNHFRRKARPTG